MRSTQVGNFAGYAVYDRDLPSPTLLRSACGPCVTLLGDAAHPMSPFKGQGANQALLDAIALAQKLSWSELGESSHCPLVRGGPTARPSDLRRQTVEEALAEYEAGRDGHRTFVLRSCESVMAADHGCAAYDRDACKN
eukprot:SAG31_NODE_4357_length_3315_cov_2.653918_2_plen_138_part_00